MTVITLEEKIESLKRGIRLEELTIKKIKEKMEGAELCRRSNLLKSIKSHEGIIKNIKEKLGHLEETW